MMWVLVDSILGCDLGECQHFQFGAWLRQPSSSLGCDGPGCAIAELRIHKKSRSEERPFVRRAVSRGNKSVCTLSFGGLLPQITDKGHIGKLVCSSDGADV